MSTIHEDHHYSITYETKDLAVVFCLRALSQYAQKTGNARIPWGGTKKEDWIAAKHQVTFRFSSTGYRDYFIAEVSRVLSSASLREIGRSDSDPAKRNT